MEVVAGVNLSSLQIDFAHLCKPVVVVAGGGSQLEGGALAPVQWIAVSLENYSQQGGVQEQRRRVKVGGTTLLLRG